MIRDSPNYPWVDMALNVPKSVLYCALYATIGLSVAGAECGWVPSGD